MTVSRFKIQLKAARLRLLQLHYESGIGHIGGNLSVLDSMMALFHLLMKKDDQFILAKGHAAGALYTVLWSLDELSDDDLMQFHADNSYLSGHPAVGWHDRIKVATGSLGHGLPVATGIAKSRLLNGQVGRVFCLMSDGEWQEGSNWEALIYSIHQKLNNLTILIDINGLQGFGTTREVASMDNFVQRFSGFDVTVSEIDGHDTSQLMIAVCDHPSRLSIILLKTVKGHGVSFMQNQMQWHYLPMSELQYAQAIEEINAL